MAPNREAGESVPIREYTDIRFEHCEEQLVASDRRIDEKVDTLREIFDMRWDHLLKQLEKIDTSIERLDAFANDINGRIKLIGAGLGFIVAVVGLIQVWRGAP